jgi:aminoglycoside phosphotransferase (APT) family kinase protein
MSAAGSWEALERALAASGLGDLEVVRREPCEYRTSFPVELLEVERLGPGRAAIVCKRSNWDELEASARLAKPRFLHDPEREACVYERLLPRGPAGPPRFHGAALEEGRSWLFVEYVEGRHLFEIGARELWEEAADWLGRFHRAFAGGELHRLAARCPLVERDAGFYRRWIERAREFDRSAPAGRRAGLDRVSDRHEQIVEALLAMPATLLHGEFYASNVLIAEDAMRVRVAPLDWELAGPGPGVLDLAALVSGWPPREREAMRDAYERALGEPVSARDLELARLQVAIQWLGWAPPEWEPPADQRRDWGAEAIEIAEALEL